MLSFLLNQSPSFGKWKIVPSAAPTGCWIGSLLGGKLPCWNRSVLEPKTANTYTSNSPKPHLLGPFVGSETACWIRNGLLEPNVVGTETVHTQLSNCTCGAICWIRNRSCWETEENTVKQTVWTIVGSECVPQRPNTPTPNVHPNTFKCTLPAGFNNRCWIRKRAPNAPTIQHRT